MVCAMIEESTITKLRDVVDLLTEKWDSLESTRFYAQAEQRSSPSRPKLIITESQLSYLSDYGFKVVDMARTFDVSVATIHRRLKDFNMSVSHSFSNIDNNVLDSIILDIKQQHPNSGYRMVLGHLRSRGLFIQQTRVRESMRRVDPEVCKSATLQVCKSAVCKCHTPIYNSSNIPWICNHLSVHMIPTGSKSNTNSVVDSYLLCITPKSYFWSIADHCW